ncbi:MAG: TolC family protein [Candidatus Bipolaricaulia bacterium]
MTVGQLRTAAAGAVGLLLLAFAAPAAGQGALNEDPNAAGDRPTATVGIVLDGPPGTYAETLSGVKRELQVVTDSDLEIRYPSRWTLTTGEPLSPKAAFDSLARAPVDLILAIGLRASHRAARGPSHPVPVVAAHVLSDAARRASPSEDTGGGAPVRSVSATGLIRGNVDVLRSLTSYSSPVILVPPSASGLAGPLREVVNTYDSTTSSWRVVPVGGTAEATLNALPSDADAAYLLTPLSLSPTERDRLLTGLTARRIPTVVHRGRRWVAQGALATRYATTTEERSRRVALHAASALRDAPADSLTTALNPTEEPVINVTTAERLGLELTTETRLRATLLGRSGEQACDSLTYAEAVRTGVRSNPRLEAARAGVAAQREEIRVERSDLLPQVQVGAEALAVNEGQAKASFGSQPERSVAATAAFSQTLYSPREYAELDIAERRQRAEEAQLKTSNKDVALQVGGAYVGVLRARAVAGAQRKNLDLARENLELAEARRTSGQVGRRAVLRFETQVAQTRQALLEAKAQVQAAKARLQEVVDKPLDGAVTVAPLSPQDSVLTLTADLFARYGDTPASQDRLITFLTDAGLTRAPELNAIDARIAAAERGLEASQRSFWAPSLKLQGGVHSYALEGGAGTSGPSVPMPSVSLPSPPNSNWNVGLSLSFPLFTGLQRDAKVDKSRAQLNQLRHRRQALRDRITRQIRARAEKAVAGYQSLRDAEAATSAATETLSLVQESYASGVADVLDLIDAQDVVLKARLAEANARYDFLLRIIRTERAIARTGPLQSATERAAFRERLRAFMSNVQ